MTTANWTKYGSDIQASDGSKLHRVRTALEAAAAVTVLKEKGRNYLPEPHGYWSQTISFFVAPTKRKTDDALDDFAKALIPDLKTTSFDSSGSKSDSAALLHYDEVIGTRRIQVQRDYTFTEPGAMDGANDGNWSDNADNTEDLRRRTWVYVFPDLATAKRHEG